MEFGLLTANVIKGTYEIDEMCVNTSATDTTNCSWEPYEKETCGSSNGTYYLHVKDTEGNISHSEGMTVIGASEPCPLVY